MLRKSLGLPSIMLPNIMLTGRVSDDGVVGVGPRFEYASTVPSVARYPRIGWTGTHFVLGFSVQYFSSDNVLDPPPCGLSAMPLLEPEATGSTSLGSPTFPDIRNP